MTGSEAGAQGSPESAGFRTSAKSRISGHALTLASPLGFFQEYLNTTAKHKEFAEKVTAELQGVSIRLKLGAARGAGWRAGTSSQGLLFLCRSRMEDFVALYAY